MASTRIGLEGASQPFFARPPVCLWLRWLGTDSSAVRASVACKHYREQSCPAPPLVGTAACLANAFTPRVRTSFETMGSEVSFFRIVQYNGGSLQHCAPHNPACVGGGG